MNFYFHLCISNTFSQLYCQLVAHSEQYAEKKHIQSLSYIWSMKRLYSVYILKIWSYLLVVGHMEYV